MKAHWNNSLHATAYQNQDETLKCYTKFLIKILSGITSNIYLFKKKIQAYSEKYFI